VQWPFGAIWYGHQMVGTEGLPAAVTVKLIATAAEHFAADAVGAGVNFKDGISDVCVVLDGHAFEKRIASGAGSGGELRAHVSIIC